MSSRAWVAFRFARIVVFVIATILSIIWTIIYTILLVRESKAYSVGQRVIVITSLTINAVSAIFMYLMIVVIFRLWQDAVRVAFLLILQLGSTVTFALFGPNLPCKSLGSGFDCRRVTSVVTHGSWALAGLLLLYGFCLGVMSYIPPPSPPLDSEAARLDTQQAYPTSPPPYSKPLIGSNFEKRRSMSSVYSQGSFIQPLLANPSVFRSQSDPSVGSISTSSHSKGAYSRPSTPSSMHSVPSLTSTIRGPQNDLTTYIPRTLPPQRMDISQPLPNPFEDPAPRFTSSSSVVALGMHLPLQLPPLALYSPYETNRGQPRPLPNPYADSRHLNTLSVPLNVTENSLSLGPWANPGTPISLRPSFQPPLPLWKQAASPGIKSFHSMVASVHSGKTSATEKGDRMASPALSARSLGLPTTPRLTVRQRPLPEA